MSMQNSLDKIVNGVALKDSFQNGDIVGGVAAATGLASTITYKHAALAISITAVQSSFASLADKAVNNQGIKVSDVMATQAALGSLLGNAAQYAGDAIGSRNKAAGKALETVGNANSKLASAYAASALALNKTKADLAVWDPHNRTGLPKITDLDASTETLKKQATS